MGAPNYCPFYNFPTIGNDMLDEPYYDAESDEFDEVAAEWLYDDVQEDLARLNEGYDIYQLRLIPGYNYGAQIIPEMKNVGDPRDCYGSIDSWKSVDKLDPADNDCYDMSDEEDLAALVYEYAELVDDDTLEDPYIPGYTLDLDPEKAKPWAEQIRAKALEERERVCRDMVQLGIWFGFDDNICWKYDLEEYGPEKAA